jgi:hypothetical protein
MAKGKPLADHEIKAILGEHINNSYGYFETELTDSRRKATEYYFGEAFGNEQEGRSQVVSTDVADTIESILPSLLRIFTASDNIVKVDPVTEEDVEIAKQATDYLNHIFNKDNEGFTTLYSMFKDALIQKNGIVKVYWDTSETAKQETYEALSEAEFTMLIDEDGVEVKEHTEYKDTTAIKQKKNIKDQLKASVPEGDMQGEEILDQINSVPIPNLHDVVIMRKETFGKVKMEAVPPEEFLIERRARSIEEASFTAHRTTKTRSELVEMGFDVDLVYSLSENNSEKYNAEVSTRY